MNTNGGTRSARRFCAASVIDEKFVQGDSHQADSAEPSESVLGLFRPAKYTLFNDKLGILRSSYQSEGTRKMVCTNYSGSKHGQRGGTSGGKPRRTKFGDDRKTRKCLTGMFLLFLWLLVFFLYGLLHFRFRGLQRSLGRALFEFGR
jgi:hypothetical protein